MIGDESGFDDAKAASAAVPLVRKARFLEYISGVLGAFLHPVPIRAVDEGPGTAPEAFAAPVPPEGRLARSGEISGPGRQAAAERAPALTNRVRAPMVFHTGPARRNGFAILGGSLDARLSHRPAGRAGDSGGKKP